MRRGTPGAGKKAGRYWANDGAVMRPAVKERATGE
jgi:hypothetical protein